MVVAIMVIATVITLMENLTGMMKVILVAEMRKVRPLTQGLPEKECNRMMEGKM